MNIKKIVRKVILEKRLIKEQKFQGKTIINVDIQPEYENYINFDLNEWVTFLNRNAALNRIVFLYNGAETLGMIDESSYMMWLLELGVEEDVINNAIFYDKGYAFFRYCIDNSVEEDNIADLVKYMIKHDINDSRDINSDMWNNFMKETNKNQQEIRELLEISDDMIHVPDLIDFINNYSNIILTGGGIEQCLKEVEISLLALDKNYEIIYEFTY